MKTTHIHQIRQLHLDVSFNGSESDGMAYQSGLSDWCRHWLPEILEQALSRYADTDLYWVLERLEVQLDTVNGYNIEDELPKLLIAALENAIRESGVPAAKQIGGSSSIPGTNRLSRQHQTGEREEHPTSPASSVKSDHTETGSSVSGKSASEKNAPLISTEHPGSQMKTPSRRSWEAFCYFLHTGRLPWSFRPDAGRTLEQAATESWQEQPHRGARADALRDTLAAPQARQRLVRQFSADWVAELAETLAPGQTSTVRQIIRVLREETTPPKALETLEYRIWETVFFFSTGRRNEISVSAIMQVVLSEPLPASTEHLLGQLASRLAQPPGAGYPAGYVAIRRAVQFMLEPLVSGESSDKPAPGRRSSAELNALRNQGSVHGTPAGMGDKSPENIPSDSKPTTGEAQHTDEALNQSLQVAGRNPAPGISGDPAPKPPAEPPPVLSYTDRATGEAGIYIENAGLVLLHPFLALFFEATGVVDAEKITDPDKALALLHFLVSGENTAPEYELVLPKILCGLSPDAVAGASPLLQKTDIDESINLLETAVGYWEALKNTSPDGLRQTFLQRPGKISRRENDWLLQVERQSFDVLLDTLPWGLSVVQLPWMDGLMWVEW